MSVERSDGGRIEPPGEGVRAVGSQSLASDPWTNIVLVLLIGYFCMTRTFAYLGIPPWNIFVGEMVLGLFLFFVEETLRRLLEVPDAFAEGVPELRKLRRPENEESDDQDNQDLAEAESHRFRIARRASFRTPWLTLRLGPRPPRTR